ncbi:hypothetical protein IW22_04330 [Chryseobacterium sp. JM1]|nr:hypothetical protein IW22_04330 [Chryseobacterium sp. JM1]
MEDGSGEMEVTSRQLLACRQLIISIFVNLNKKDIKLLLAASITSLFQLPSLFKKSKAIN